MKLWPPRLPDQPIFYPVLNHLYARQIARDWNTKFDACAGYVTQFEVADEFISKYEIKIVGGKEHQELWIPADELEQLNSNIQGSIQVVEAFFGDDFLLKSRMDGYRNNAQGAEHSLWDFGQILDYNKMDFELFVSKNKEMIFLYFPFWLNVGNDQINMSKERRDEILSSIESVWKRQTAVPLCQNGYFISEIST